MKLRKGTKRYFQACAKYVYEILSDANIKDISVVQYIDMLDCLEDIIDDDNEMIEVLEDYFNQEDNEE